MAETNKNRREPLVRVAKRGEMVFWKRWMIRIVAALLALVFVGILIIALTKGQVDPLNAYEKILDGAFGTTGYLWSTLRDTMILLLVALALAPAFRMKFWNIGGEGQILVGGLMTAIVMLFGAGHMPTWLLFILMIVTSMLAGLIWGLIPAFFKAHWNTNETLFTLMMNYVAIQLVTYCNFIWDTTKGQAKIDVINRTGEHAHVGWLPTDFLSGLFGDQNYVINVIVVLGITIFMYIYLKYTKHGYEIAVVGESTNTARYSGISIKKVVLRTMALSGAICGLAGFLIVSGSSHTITAATADGRGFTAIIVAWMSKFNPIIMLGVALMLVSLDKGFSLVGTSYYQYGLNGDFAAVVTGFLLFFLIGCEFFIEYRLIFRSRKGGK